MSVSLSFWIGFNLFVFFMILLDMKVFHRHSHEVGLKEALGWSAFWIILALLFALGVYRYFGLSKTLEYLTGYVIEKSLSVDNIFVFLAIFSYFHVAPKYQHKILFWGILGALFFRAFFILVGIKLIQMFHWTLYVFGAILIYTGIKLAFQKEEEIHPEKNPVLRLVQKLMPVTHDHQGGQFFVRSPNNRLMATPLFVALIVVETTDILFAFDSIPAVLAVSLDPFIVYTSNVFAILGLRALYFAVAGLMKKVRFLHFGLAFILAFAGMKILISDYYKIPLPISLSVILGVLILTILISFLADKKRI